jgi:hypothetical protein
LMTWSSQNWRERKVNDAKDLFEGHTFPTKSGLQSGFLNLSVFFCEDRVCFSRCQIVWLRPLLLNTPRSSERRGKNLWWGLKPEDRTKDFHCYHEKRFCALLKETEKMCSRSNSYPFNSFR